MVRVNKFGTGSLSGTGRAKRSVIVYCMGRSTEGFIISVTTILFEVGSYRTVVG